MSNPSIVPPPRPALRITSPATVVVAVPAVKQPTEMPAPVSTGPRKLVRPKLPEGMMQRGLARQSKTLLTRHGTLSLVDAPKVESTHAEVFYFQKQMHAQTLMTFVLDDGETIEGIIEWYDRDVVKVRHRGRTMIYKSCIKYLYKSEEKNGFGV